MKGIEVSAESHLMAVQLFNCWHCQVFLQASAAALRHSCFPGKRSPAHTQGWVSCKHLLLTTRLTKLPHTWALPIPACPNPLMCPTWAVLLPASIHQKKKKKSFWGFASRICITKHFYPSSVVSAFMVQIVVLLPGKADDFWEMIMHSSIDRSWPKCN